MAKTAILAAIGKQIDLIEGSLGKIDLATKPPVKKDVIVAEFAKIDTALQKIRSEGRKFEAKVNSWKNPTFLNKAKNVFKNKEKLETARKDAIVRFGELIESAIMLERQSESAQRLVKKFGIQI